MVGGAVELRPEVYGMEQVIAIDEIGMQLTGLRNLEMETLCMGGKGVSVYHYGTRDLSTDPSRAEPNPAVTAQPGRRNPQVQCGATRGDV